MVEIRTAMPLSINHFLEKELVDTDSSEGPAACVVIKLSRELAKQAVITKCRGNIIAQPAVPLKKPWFSVPKKSVIITISLDIKNLC